MQNTLKKTATLSGVGLHSGKIVNLAIHPAEENHGIIFVRTDITDKDNKIPALWSAVADTQLCTVIANKDGASIGTIEHLMAALRGLNIDNALIEVDAAEVPIMDGSSAPFIEALMEAGIETQATPRRMIRILKEVSVEKDGKRVTLSPSDIATFGGVIDFEHPEIGRQSY